MLLFEIESQIQPLTRQEKRQLVHDVLKMLAAEAPDEREEGGDYLTSGQEVGFWSAWNEDRMAAQLQEYLDQGKL